MTPFGNLWRQVRKALACWTLALALSFPGTGWASARSRDKRPNVVFILADDLGWRDLSCYGSTYHETPNIDKLASQGMRFTDYYTSPVCMPSRLGILTGKNPSRMHNLWGDKQPCNTFPWDNLPKGERTITEDFKQAGYATGMVGKWHLGVEGSAPSAPGFSFISASGKYWNLPNYNYPYELESMEGKGDVGYLTDYMGLEAQRFLTENRDRPLFLYLSYYAVHSPIQAKPGTKEKYEKKLGPGEPQRNPTYAAMTASLDQSVGGVLDKLRSLGLEKNTLVVFASDNGGELGGGKEFPPIANNSPLRGGKTSMYEGGIRVPLMVRWPGVVKAGSLSSEPAMMTDLAPTFRDAAGIQPSSGPADGLNLRPVLSGKSGLGREYFCLQWGPAAIRQGRWKLIETFESKAVKPEVKNGKKKNGRPAVAHKVELYDLETDLSENIDLSGEEAGRVADLRGKLHAWLREMDPAGYSVEKAGKIGLKLPVP